MVFCLDDGAKLVDPQTRDANATLNLPVAPTISAGAPPRPPQTDPNPLPTITAKPEHFQMPPAYAASQPPPSQTRRSPLPWIFGIVLVLGVSGVVIAWLVTRPSGDQTEAKLPQPTPFMSPGSTPDETPITFSSPTPGERATPTPTPDRKREDDSKPTPKPTPTIEKPKPAFAVLNNMTFNGSRITYYPRASFGACQADCSANSNCRGFTWIRPGAYNPGDSAMCYLMSAVTARVPHACCISGVRNN